MSSNYERGKREVECWSYHWNKIADASDKRSTVEAKLVEYGQPIRESFTQSYKPEILMRITPHYIQETHALIMHPKQEGGILSQDQREAVIVWHFGEDDERKDYFGKTNREPPTLKAVYQKIGRKFR